ncbi:MAG: hypothetical protein ABJD97_13265 [Betaproteobacteria bacterium]
MALLALAGWWVARAPLVERPAARAPDIDLDPPALRAQREAALALATAPDDPWTFAQSLGASAPEAGADKARCGDDERPRFADPEVRDGSMVMDQLAAAGPHYLAARARMDAALRASADRLDRAVADWLDVGQMRTPAGRVDALVQQALTTTNARVYSLAYRTCLAGRPATASCAALSARRWADIDAGNGVPWLFAFDQARNANDAAGQQDALARLAAASRFDEYHFAQAAAVAAHAGANEQDLAAFGDLSAEAVGKTFAVMTPVPTLFAACRGKAGGDVVRAQQCQAISDAMFDHTDSVFLRGMSGALQAQTTGDETRREVARAERALAARDWSPATGFSECQQARDVLKILLRKGQVGEVEEARERARVFVTP